MGVDNSKAVFTATMTLKSNSMYVNNFNISTLLVRVGVIVFVYFQKDILLCRGYNKKLNSIRFNSNKQIF